MYNEPRNVNETNSEEMELVALFSQNGGFERYASDKMPAFIQTQRDYRGFVRDVIKDIPVTKEDLVREDEEVYVMYSKDLDATAAVMPRNGEIPTMRAKGRTVKVGFRELSTPEIVITQWDIDTQAYDYIKRTQEKSGQELARLEDTWFLDLANTLMDHFPEQNCTSSNAVLEKSDLVMVKSIFTKNEVSFSSYLMNPALYDEFLLWGENDLDPMTQQVIFQTGELPTIWGGIKMVSGIMVPTNVLYGLAPREILGRMPILRDVTIRTHTKPETDDKGISAFEYIGLFIHSHNVIARCQFVNKVDDGRYSKQNIDKVKREFRNDGLLTYQQQQLAAKAGK